MGPVERMVLYSVYGVLCGVTHNCVLKRVKNRGGRECKVSFYKSLVTEFFLLWDAIADDLR